MNVDLIIKSKWIAPVDGETALLTDHSVVIKDKRLVALCSQEELKDKYSSSTEIQLNDHILIPGLINAHGHAPMALLRGVADDLALEEWLKNRVWPLEQKFITPQFVADGAELAIAEMI